MNSDTIYTVLKMENGINNPIDKIKVDINSTLGDFIEVTKIYMIQVYSLYYTYIYYSFDDIRNIITVHCSHKPMEQYEENKNIIIKELIGERDVDDYEFIIKFTPDRVECCVCYEDHSKTKFYHCDHSICEKCYDQWNTRNVTCPMCRGRSLVAINNNNDGGEGEEGDIVNYTNTDTDTDTGTDTDTDTGTDTDTDTDDDMPALIENEAYDIAYGVPDSILHGVFDSMENEGYTNNNNVNTTEETENEPEQEPLPSPEPNDVLYNDGGDINVYTQQGYALMEDIRQGLRTQLHLMR